MIQKKRLFGGLLMFAVASAIFIACEPDDTEISNLITFEDINLGSTGFYIGSDKIGTPVSYESWGQMVTEYYGGFRSGSLFCNTIYNETWNSWSGMACSNHVNMDSAGYFNQYSVFANSGAGGSSKFILVNSDGSSFVFDNVVTVKSLMINNSTYAYKALKDGNDGGAGFARKFVNNDYFYVKMTGYDSTGVEKASREFYLADFRNGKSFICDKWTEISLEEFGRIKEISFSFVSTDSGDWGINTPVYCCIDNIKYVE